MALLLMGIRIPRLAIVLANKSKVQLVKRASVLFNEPPSMFLQGKERSSCTLGGASLPVYLA